MTEAQWTPDHEFTSDSRITDAAAWLSAHRGLPPEAVADYRAFQRWSVTHLEEFWEGLAEYFEVAFASAPQRILSGTGVQDARWFDGATLNFAEHISLVSASAVAVVVEDENGDSTSHTYGQLRADIASMARYLRHVGVEIGDRVVGYLPNCYEGVVALFAAASVGATWSQVGSDYSAAAAANRLGQLDAKVLLAGAGYVFRGARFERHAEAAALRALLKSVAHTISVPTLADAPPIDNAVPWKEAIAAGGSGRFEPVPVPFDHPLWVLFTSGATGAPKGIVHGHGGALLEMLKTLGLHLDVRAGDVYFWYTTPNWVMWNLQVAGLLLGATVVLYVGDPLYPDVLRLWELVDRNRVNLFGTSPAHILATQATGLRPPRCQNLRQILSTGSPLPASANEWARAIFGSDMSIGSTSGGTDIASSFVGSNPMTPIWDGELSAPGLAVALEAWNDDGGPVIGAEGEMVITKPMPSMPVGLWGDDSGERYRETYFSTFEGVWRQGDWITVTERGTVMMHGRSDATLNRRGIRLGSAEIYDAIEQLPDVADSLVVGIEQPDGGYWMPLFIVPGPEWQNVASQDRITQAIADHASKHHVPDDIIRIPAVPRTRTGKKTEVPVKRVLLGADPTEIGAIDACGNPEALRWFQQFTAERHAS